MGFTGAHVLYTFDVFILALYLLFHGCALLKYTCKSLKMGELETPSKAQTNERLFVTKASQFKYTPSTLVFCGGRNFKPLGVKFLPCSSPL